MNKQLNSLAMGVVLALMAAAAGLALSSAVQAQPPAMMFGQFNGSPKALSTDATGQLEISATADPCFDPNSAKTSVAVTTTGQQVAISGTTTIYVCAFYASMTGTGPTVQLQAGTGANCGTGTVSLSGAFALTVGNELILDSAGTVTKTAPGQAFCATTGGTTPTIAGLMTYVQQ